MKFGIILFKQKINHYILSIILSEVLRHFDMYIYGENMALLIASQSWCLGFLQVENLSYCIYCIIHNTPHICNTHVYVVI